MTENPSEKTKSFHKGQIIFKEGQPTPVAYMVKKGKVSLYRVVNNRRVRLQVCMPGQIFGELTLLNGEPSRITAEAADFCELMVMDKELYHTLLIKSPNIIQRILRNMTERLTDLEGKVLDQPANDVFMGVCQVIELLSRAAVCVTSAEEDSAKVRAAKERKVISTPTGPATRRPDGVSYAELLRTAKNILVVSQLELDRIILKLHSLGLIRVMDEKCASYEKDLLGKMSKSREYLKDRRIVIKDPHEFLNVARNVSREEQKNNPGMTRGLEFVDVTDFASMAETTAEMVYKKIGNQEIPEHLFFLPRHAVTEWVGEVGKDYFKRTKRKKINLEDLETVDDVVYLADRMLKPALKELGFAKVATLYAAAGDDARDKIRKLLSAKIAQVVEEESANSRASDTEIGQVEEELFELVKKG